MSSKAGYEEFTLSFEPIRNVRIFCYYYDGSDCFSQCHCRDPKTEIQNDEILGVINISDVLTLVYKLGKTHMCTLYFFEFLFSLFLGVADYCTIYPHNLYFKIPFANYFSFFFFLSIYLFILTNSLTGPEKMKQSTARQKNTPMNKNL